MFVFVFFTGSPSSITYYFSESDLHLTQTFLFLWICWDIINMSVSLPPDKLADIQHLALSLLHIMLLSVRPCLFRYGQFLCQWPLSTVVIVTCHSEWYVGCLSFSSSIIFFCTIFCFIFASTWVVILFRTEPSSFALSTSPCGYFYRMPHPIIGPFIFRILDCHYWLVDPGLGLCVRLILPCRNFRQLAMMLGRMAFWISGKVVTLHLDNCTAKAYLCKSSGTVSPFLSRLACWILNLTDKHSSTLIPAYIPTHVNIVADYLSQGRLLPEWHLHHIVQAAFQLWGLQEVDLSAISPSRQCKQYYTLGKSTTSRGLGVGGMCSVILRHLR